MTCTDEVLGTDRVAEQLVRQAGRIGVPVAVYRPGRIIGDSTSGATGSDDAFWHYVRACVEIGDFVAAAVVALSTAVVPEAATYHLLDPLLSVGEVVARARAHAYPVVEIPHTEWNERLRRAAATREARRGDPVQATALFEQVIGAHGHSRPLNYGTSITDRTLANSGVRCPTVDGELLDRCYRFFAEAGLLSAPALPAVMELL